MGGFENELGGKKRLSRHLTREVMPANAVKRMSQNLDCANSCYWPGAGGRI